jgi:hypothetical protein
MNLILKKVSRNRLLTFIAVLFYTTCLYGSSLHLGMTSAVKSKIKDLDNKIADNKVQKQLQERSLHIKGYGLSPQGFPVDYSKLPEFLTEVGQLTRGGVFWNGAWRDSAAASGQIPAAAKLVLGNAATYGYAPIICFGWRSGTTVLLDVPANATKNWTNSEAQSLFRQMLVDCATTYQPPYIFIGNENSLYYEQDAVDYSRWITFYNSCYDAIKQVSPQTRVGTVFNYEHLSGRGELVGWSTTTYWEALTAHDLNKVDIVGITLYPWFYYYHAADVQNNYLDALYSRINDKTIAITETGWPASNPAELTIPEIWTSSEQEQVAYVPKIFSLINGRDCPIVNWLFLYDMADDGTHSTAWQMFGSVAFKDSNNNARPALAGWLAQE